MSEAADKFKALVKLVNTTKELVKDIQDAELRFSYENNFAWDVDRGIINQIEDCDKALVDFLSELASQPQPW